MASNSTLLIRDAVPGDLAAIVALLTDDPYGREREVMAVEPGYARALAAIAADPNNRQLVAVEEGEVIGCF